MKIYWLIFPLTISILACGQTVPATDQTPTSLSQTNIASEEADPYKLWFKTLGDAKSDQLWGVDTDLQGNIYATGYMQIPATALFFDIVVYKFTLEGEEIWRTQWGNEYQQKGFVVSVKEPYVYVGGLTHKSLALEEADMALLCLDMESGEVLWDFSWGQGFGYEEVDGLIVSEDGIFLSGWTTGETTSGDIAVLKLDLLGNLLWAKTWGTAGFDEADGQMVVDEETIYVSGRINADNMLFGGDAVVVAFSRETGDYMDHVTWGGNSFDDALGMTSDGTYLYLVGLTTSFGKGGQIFILKLDKHLGLIWHKLWGGEIGESARVIEVGENGSIYIAGATGSIGNGQDDALFLVYSQEGDLLTQNSWGGSGQEAIHGMALDGSWGYMAGNTTSYGLGMNDGLLIKVDLRKGIFPKP